MTTPTIFQKVTLTWAGKDHVIPPTRLLMAIAAVEEIVSLPELAAMYFRGPIKFAKLAMAYATLLRFSGAPVTDDEVFKALFPSQPGNILPEAIAKLDVLIKMMTPPDVLIDKSAKKPQAAASGEVSSPGSTSSSAAPASVH